MINKCFQKIQKDRFLEEDLMSWNMTQEKANQLSVKNFHFEYIDSKDKEKCEEVKQFIERYEWMGKLNLFPTHRFAFRYKGKLVAVVIMGTPNAFSTHLGKSNFHLEKLISRGATVSFAPKNTASALIARSIKFMVKNTQFRAFTAYSDSEASELGTIYQACNFIYLGKNFGARELYYDPENPKRGWFTSRLFRKVGQYKKYAKIHEIRWQKEWSSRYSMNWDCIPEQVVHILKQEARNYKKRCKVRKVPRKHKYILIKGENRNEERKLKRIFIENNPDLVGKDGKLGLPYPKLRGQ